jgi:hypothetical protein
MNYGKILSWTIVILSFGASIGYAIAKEYRTAVYWFFAGCISATMSY